MNTRRAKGYLKLWGGFQEYANDLNAQDRKCAAILFHSLAELPRGEVEFLAKKYVTGISEKRNFLKQVPLSDAELAVKLGYSTNACREKRLIIEMHMEEKLSKYVGMVESREIDEAPAYLLRLGRLFYKEHRGDEIVFTPIMMLAKVFSRESAEGEKIMDFFGLEKVISQRDYFTKSDIVM